MKVKKLTSILMSIVVVFSVLCSPAVAAVEKIDEQNFGARTTYYDGTWQIYHYSAPATGEVLMDACTTKVNITHAVNKVTSICSSYYSTQAPDGSKATVKFSGYFTDTLGTTYGVCVGYHYDETPSPVETNRTIPATATLWLNYNINSAPSAYYNLSGTASA